MEQFLNDHKIWLEVIIVLGVIVFGFLQYSINKRLKQLQDYIAMAVVPDSKTNKINLLNTGKVNLYLWGFDMPGNNPRLEKPRLIAAGTGDTAYYWIDPPFIQLEHLQPGPYEFEFKLYLEDEFKNKWISEHGGRADKIKIEKDGEKVDAVGIKVWSYKIYKEKWSF